MIGGEKILGPKLIYKGRIRHRTNKRNFSLITPHVSVFIAGFSACIRFWPKPKDHFRDQVNLPLKTSSKKKRERGNNKAVSLAFNIDSMTATSCSDSTECSSSSREQELGSSAHGPWDGHWSADEDVLKDKAVMACYMRAIVEHGAVEGKTVLDLSCGSGILSLLAARHGATHVYSVDVPPIIDLLKKIAEQNDLADKITCIPAQYFAISAPLNLPSEYVHFWSFISGYFSLISFFSFSRRSDPSPAMCRARRLSYQLPVEKVDVIMFRSFGFCIFSESSWLIDLIYARDHFLKVFSLSLTFFSFFFLLLTTHHSLNLFLLFLLFLISLQVCCYLTNSTCMWLPWRMLRTRRARSCGGRTFMALT